MGNVREILAQSDLNTRHWPFIDRFIIEDNVGETVHIHLNNLRLEFTRQQFLELANLFDVAAVNLRKIIEHKREHGLLLPEDRVNG